MKQLLIPCLALLMIAACKDEITVKNQPPVAIAGNDTTIVLPVDNFLLNGGASYDGDGKIKTYRWRQILGSNYVNLGNYLQAQVKVTNLVAGNYYFELKVTDDQDMFATDTLVVRVEPAVPVKITVDAGDSQTLVNGISSATLEGKATSDPAGAELKYEWKQITGANSLIKSPKENKTIVLFNKPGNYQFELKVYNSNDVAYGKTSVTVNNSQECEVSRTRAEVKFELVKQLPIEVINDGMFAAGNKLLFLQSGFLQSGSPMDFYVEGMLSIYNPATGELTHTEMDMPMDGYTVAVGGNKILFAGRVNLEAMGPPSTDLVNIYDLISKSWTTAKLSEPRGLMATATLGSKVYFAGGIKPDGKFSKKVDIFDTQTGTWTSSEFKGVPRAIQTAVTAQNKIYFIGGYSSFDQGFAVLFDPSRTIDIFNGNTGLWEIDDLQVLSNDVKAIAAGDKIFIAGRTPEAYHDKLPLNVEVINTNNNSRSNLCLPKSGIAGLGLKNNSIAFIHAQQIDIYNTSTGQWSIAESQFSSYNSIVSINNEIYVLVGRNLYKMNF